MAAKPSRCRLAVSRRVGGPLPGSGNRPLSPSEASNISQSPKVLSAREAPRPSTSQLCSVIGSATDKRAPFGEVPECRTERKVQMADFHNPRQAISAFQHSDVEGRGTRKQCEGNFRTLPHALASLTCDRKSHVHFVAVQSDLSVLVPLSCKAGRSQASS